LRREPPTRPARGVGPRQESPSRRSSEPSVLLGRLQRGLQDIYRIDLDLDVADYLCDAPFARAHDEGSERREMLLVSPSDERGEVGVALWVDPAIVERLERSHPARWILGDQFDAYCVGLEGVSHFVYLAFHGCSGRPVTELELELQAEVDKFVACSLAVRRLENAVRLVGVIHRRLFDDPCWIDEAGTERGERYRLASSLAARYTARLERLYFARSRIVEMLHEVRRFYRLTQREKIDEILREAA
jgi:hypothetical protein